MIAVDTNVVVRLLTEDHPEQTAAARALFAAGPIWIAKTVLLETRWVLRRLYGLDESTIRDAFTRLLGFENVHAEDEGSVAAALARIAHGLHFADAMLLSYRPAGSACVPFDRSFVRRANRAGAAKVSALQMLR